MASTRSARTAAQEIKAWRRSDIGDLTGTVAVVTGANQGLGFVTTRVLAEAGATVVMAVRSMERGTKAKANIERGWPTAKLSAVQIDLSDLSSVETGAKSIVADHAEIGLLINNAGIMAVPRATSVDGFEMQFAANHLGHFALTGHLLSGLEAGSGRVVALASLAANSGTIRFGDLQHEQRYDRWSVYQQTKLANLMFAMELAERAVEHGSSITATAAHPGVSATNLGSGLKDSILAKVQSVMFSIAGQSPEHGATPTLAAAIGPVPSGGYVGPDGFAEYRGRHVAPASVPKKATDADDRDLLWTESEALTGVRYFSD